VRWWGWRIPREKAPKIDNSVFYQSLTVFVWNWHGHCDSHLKAHGQWRPGESRVKPIQGQGRPSELPTGGQDETPILFLDSRNQGASNGRQ
jgi:hypothetical protein